MASEVETALWFGVLAGLLAGAGVGGHGLRLVMLSRDPEQGLPEWVASLDTEPLTGRHVVAYGALAVYGVGAVLAVVQVYLACWIAIAFPVLGITSVSLLREARVDAFQVVLGIPQAAAAAVAAWLLFA